MPRVVLSNPDVDRKRPLHIARTALRYLARGKDVDPESVNQKTPKVFGYPNSHAMHAEAGQTPMPAPGTVSRLDIQLGLTKNLCETEGVPFLTAFRAIGKGKLQTLDIDQQTIEACAEEASSTFQEIMVDTQRLLDGPLRSNPRIGKLITVGAPKYRVIVRKDAYAFDWPHLISVSEAIEKTAGRILLCDPMVVDCHTPEETINRYLRDVVIPQAWVPIEELVSDGLEIPHHEVLALYTKDGIYIGRVIHNTKLHAVIPKLFYTDHELAKGMVDFFLGRCNENLELGRIVHKVDIWAQSVDVGCDEPVFLSRLAGARGLSVKSTSIKHTVKVDTLDLLPGLRCGSWGDRWAIDGELSFLHKGDRSMYEQGYAPTDIWESAMDFPLLFPLEQDVSPAVAPSWLDRFKVKLLLPPETVEFQQRLSQKLRRDIADAREVMEDPVELSALLRLLLQQVSSEEIERNAGWLEASYYAEAQGASESKNEEERLKALRQRDQENRPRLVALLLVKYPFLSPFGPMTQWITLLRAGGAISQGMDADLPSVVAILVELVVLASASAAGNKPIHFSLEPAILAVGLWAEGRSSLEEVLDLVSLFTRYQNQASCMEAKVASVGAAVSEAIDSRERARELGVRYAGERVTVRPSSRLKDL